MDEQLSDDELSEIISKFKYDHSLLVEKYFLDTKISASKGKALLIMIYVDILAFLIACTREKIREETKMMVFKMIDKRSVEIEEILREEEFQ